jgi:hypothetical protein
LNNIFFTTILPSLVTLLGFFLPSLTYPLKAIIPLSFAVAYFLGIGIYWQCQLKKAKANNTTLATESENLKFERDHLYSQISSYDEFVHKRQLFLRHDLTEIGTLLTEYEVHVKDTYRGLKYQDVRESAGSVKKRTLEIVNKEKRDFDEQLYHIQSNKNN